MSSMIQKILIQKVREFQSVGCIVTKSMMKRWSNTCSGPQHQHNLLTWFQSKARQQGDIHFDVAETTGWLTTSTAVTGYS